ncbi:MAG: type I-D CRISPR-associated helicase Cas3', partial [Thermosynechococcaceae cyanobacterium]
MQVILKPLFSRLNTLESCPLDCQDSCQIKQIKALSGESCPLSVHQVQTYAEVKQGDADVIFSTAVTGDGKSLAAYLPALRDPRFRIMGLYPTIELVEDQTRSQQGWHKTFELDAAERIDCLFGEELSQRVQQAGKSSKYTELLKTIELKPIILTNPDIFHLMTHGQYRTPQYNNLRLPMMLADFPDLWVFDEFHIFGPHQETAVLNSMIMIRQTQQNRRPRRFLFTSATPKQNFIAQLQQAGLKTQVIAGSYTSEDISGYRQILQSIELDFVTLGDGGVIDWLTENVTLIRELLETERQGRGLIILNSVAQAGQAVKLLSELLPMVQVQEISGRVDRQGRSQTQAALQNSEQPVLVVGTSAVDVGVDFDIHLLIFEGSDSATVIQRLGRLGRHAGFTQYKAFLLISGRTPWVMATLEEQLQAESTIDRHDLMAAIDEAFTAPKEFERYRDQWGVLQAQGMLAQFRTQESGEITKPIRQRMTADLQKVYGEKFEQVAYCRLKELDKSVVSAVQDELIRFRGSSSLQAAVWDGDRFYTSDLLRLLPYTQVHII